MELGHTGADQPLLECSGDAVEDISLQMLSACLQRQSCLLAHPVRLGGRTNGAKTVLQRVQAIAAEEDAKLMQVHNIVTLKDIV